ncbi:hypothetical protein STEG23_002145, partial [Scotinomys teguina]
RKMQHASGCERLIIVSCEKNNSLCLTVSYRKFYLLLRKSHIQKTYATKTEEDSDSRKIILHLTFSKEVIPLECHHADRKESNLEGQKRKKKGKRGKTMDFSFMTAYSENRSGKNIKDSYIGMFDLQLVELYGEDWSSYSGGTRGGTSCETNGGERGRDLAHKENTKSSESHQGPLYCRGNGLISNRQGPLKMLSFMCGMLLLKWSFRGVPESLKTMQPFNALHWPSEFGDKTPLLKKRSRMQMLLPVLMLTSIVQSSDGGFGDPCDARAILAKAIRKPSDCNGGNLEVHPLCWKIHPIYRL